MITSRSRKVTEGLIEYEQDILNVKPMTPEEISDVVAWLASRRQGPAPGQTAQTAEATTTGTQPSTSNQ